MVQIWDFTAAGPEEPKSVRTPFQLHAEERVCKHSFGRCGRPQFSHTLKSRSGAPPGHGPDGLGFVGPELGPPDVPKKTPPPPPPTQTSSAGSRSSTTVSGLLRALFDRLKI